MYEQKHSFAGMSLLFAGNLVVESWQQILLHGDHSSMKGKRKTEASHSLLSLGVLIKSPGKACVSFVNVNTTDLHLCQFTFPEVTMAVTCEGFKRASKLFLLIVYTYILYVSLCIYIKNIFLLEVTLFSAVMCWGVSKVPTSRLKVE